MRIFSKQSQCPQDSPIVHSCLKLHHSQLGSCLPAFSRSKILFSRQWERKSIGSGWGSIPLLEVFHLGCFLLTQLKAPCHMSLEITFIKFLLSVRLSSKKATSMKKTACLACIKEEIKVVSFWQWPLLFQRNKDIHREIRCSSPSSFPLIPSPEFPQSKPLILCGWNKEKSLFTKSYVCLTPDLPLSEKKKRCIHTWCKVRDSRNLASTKWVSNFFWWSKGPPNSYFKLLTYESCRASFEYVPVVLF